METTEADLYHLTEQRRSKGFRVLCPGRVSLVRSRVDTFWTKKTNREDMSRSRSDALQVVKLSAVVRSESESAKRMGFPGGNIGAADRNYSEQISVGVHTFRFSRLAPCVNTLHSRNAAARARLSLRRSILSMAPLWRADVAAKSTQLLKAARVTGFWREASAKDAAALWREKEATRLLKPSKACACESGDYT
jgi:hypothetical protein